MAKVPALSTEQPTSVLGRFKAFLGKFVIAPSPVLFSVREYLLLRPVVFALWFHLRRFMLRLSGHAVRSLGADGEMSSEFVSGKVLPYNLSMLWTIARGRTERLMNVLRSIHSLDRRNSSLLVIGPRNEAELLLLSCYGFPLKKMAAIDLFSYSPLIDLMDMHALNYPDNSFDVVYSCFVITYSDQIPRACEEAARVARDGALVVFAFEHLTEGYANKLGVNRLNGGLSDLFKHFEGHIDHIFWQEEFRSGTSVTCSTVFRIRKPAATAPEMPI